MRIPRPKYGVRTRNVDTHTNCEYPAGTRVKIKGSKMFICEVLEFNPDGITWTNIQKDLVFLRVISDPSNVYLAGHEAHWRKSQIEPLP